MELKFSAVTGPFNPQEKIERIKFGVGGGLIGRAAECQLILDDGQRHVSRQHVRVGHDGQQFTLEVLSEISPIKVNTSTHAHGQRCIIKDGDDIAIGPFVIRAHISKPVLNSEPAPTVSTTTISVPVLQWLGSGMKHSLRLQNDAQLEPFIKQYGEMMAELLDGTRKLAALRSESKSEFVPTDRTTVARTDANPIKHAGNRQDLFKAMFPEMPSPYIDPVQSVRDVMSDLRMHEAAMQAGMRAAMQFMLTQVDPNALGLEDDGVLAAMRNRQRISELKKRHQELKEGVSRGANSAIWDAFRDGYREEIRLQRSKGNPGSRS